jgi:hypothetical protein
MFALPDNKGFFEIRTEAGDSKGRSSPKKVASNSLVVYFYHADGTTELSPAPADVMVKVGAAASSTAVPLAPQTKGGFVSAPAYFPPSFRGQLLAKINGESVETTFVVR